MAKPSPSATGASCKNCPSFIAGMNQARLLGTGLNGPICGIKMLPLIMPNQGQGTQDKVFRHVAKRCDKYGTDVRVDPLRPEAAPSMPVGMDTNAAVPGTSDVQSDATCYGCSNFISPAAVQAKTGWTGAICRASGNLMPDNRYNQYAKSCGSFVRRSFASKDPWKTFTFFPQFAAKFGEVDVAKMYREAVAHIVEPKTWPTDKEVTPGNRRKGIRAWRRVTDPDNFGDDVFLPVYDPDAMVPDSKGEMVPFLTDAEKELVPVTGSDEHPELYADHGQIIYGMVVLFRYLDETPALWGQGGTGKTELLRHLAWLMQLPYHRIPISPTSEVDDIIGKILFKNGETVPHYGQLTTAWSRPSVILLDEPNTGPPEVVQVLRPLTDNSRLLKANSLEGERFQRGDHTYFALAMNPAWDPRNIGAQTLGDADSSRLMHVYFDYPPRDLEMEIIQQRTRLDKWEVPMPQLNALMEVTDKLRQASSDGVLHTTWGVRHNIKVARALRFFTPVKAFRRAVGDSLEPSQLDFLLTSVKAHFGD